MHRKVHDKHNKVRHKVHKCCVARNTRTNRKMPGRCSNGKCKEQYSNLQSAAKYKVYEGSRHIKAKGKVQKGKGQRPQSKSLCKTRYSASHGNTHDRVWKALQSAAKKGEECVKARYKMP